MKKGSRKDLIFLATLIIITVAISILVYYLIQVDPIESETGQDNLLKTLVVLEKDGKAFSTNVIVCYQDTKRAAMFDVPSNTGLILRSLGRTDEISAVYTEQGIEAYKKEIEKLLGITIPFYISCDINNFSKLTDMLSGLMIFIPTPVDYGTDDKRILLPSGAVQLDGDKMHTYLTYSTENDNASEAVGRKQTAILAFLRAINSQAENIFGSSQATVFTEKLSSNLSKQKLQHLLIELGKIDSDRLVPQRLTGASRIVEGKTLLFPFRDGQQIKDILKQTMGALVAEDGSTMERVYALEILNATDTRGLAKKTAETYQSFGYDVINIGNNEDDLKQTVLIDRIGNPNAAKIVGQVIRCDNIRTTTLPENSANGSESAVDFTLILGSDFNGYYVIKKE